MVRTGIRLTLGALLLFVPRGALAQHMYLDTDGDGVHTAADAIRPTGVTTLDLWLRTDARRDGSPSVCDTGDGDLTINGYEFILHTLNGTVAWGATTNRISEFSSLVSPVSNSSDLHAGAYGLTLPPGTYRLATVEVSVATGTPAVVIAPSSALSGAFVTAFASQCSGLDFSNTLTLGVDWFDVDGAVYGGTPNSPPAIDPVPDLLVLETSTLDQPLVARDPDGNPVEFSKTSGPAFMTVTTIDQGAGAASGRVHLAPGYFDAGSALASVSATDHVATATAEFRITVQDLNRAPTLDQPSDMNLRTGVEQSQELHASDPDGGRLEFLLVSGPPYITVATTEPFSPATGRVTGLPSAYDEGEDSVTVAATDGELRSERTFFVRVFRSISGSTLLCRPHDMTIVAGQVAEQVIMATNAFSGLVLFSLVDSPPFASITPLNAGTPPQTAVLRVAPGPSSVGVYSATVQTDTGGASARETCRITVLAQPATPQPQPDLLASAFRSYDVCDIPQGAVLADLNRDGRLDLLTPNYGCGISILLGIGGGQFASRTDLHLDGNPKGIEVTDLDGDGDLDAAVSIGYGDQIAILAGDGSGSFTQAAALPAGPDASYAAIADVNRDGIMDIVGADEEGNSISVYLGLGALGYGSRTIYPAGAAPCYVTVADFDGDGIPDAAAANENSNAISLHLGHGDGTFAPHTLLPTAPGPSSVRSGDFNEDGHPDLAASGFHSNYLTVLLGDGHGAFPSRLDLETGLAPWSLTTTDVNGDGHLDLVSANTAVDNVGTILGNGDGTFRPVLFSPTGSIPRFVTGGDLDGDRRVDLVVANEIGGTVSVVQGHGDGRFGSLGTIGSGPVLDVVAGDLTGDGIADLVVVQETGTAQAHSGLAGGGFNPPVDLAPGAPSQSAKVADMNGDGTPDLILLLESDSWALYFGGPTFGQSPPLIVTAGGHASGIETGDWNHDGHRDVVETSGPERRLTLLDGDGAGGFTNRRDIALEFQPRLLSTGDWDGDGWTDLAVDIGIRGTMVLWGNGTGVIPGPLLPAFQGATGSASGDLDGDGRAELVVAEAGSRGGLGIFSKGPHGRIAVYRWATRESAPSRTVYPGGSIPFAPRIADLTGDGRPDVILTEVGANAIGVLAGLPGGSLDVSRDYGMGSHPHGLALADANRDGRLDVLVGDGSGGGTALLRNLGAPPPPLAARAFVRAEDRTLRLQAAKPYLCTYLEPVNASFTLADVDLATIRMVRTDVEAPPIAAIASKGALTSDVDRNGVLELAACFARGDLRTLFASVHGSREVPVAVTGDLMTGGTFRAALSLHVTSERGGPPAVTVMPNPFNPTGTLTFTLAHPGRLRVTLHDVMGRTVARLADSKAAPAGEHRFQLGGGDARDGEPRGGGARGGLASGVYFYRVETPDGVATGRLAIVK